MKIHTTTTVKRTVYKEKEVELTGSYGYSKNFIEIIQYQEHMDNKYQSTRIEINRDEAKILLARLQEYLK